MNEASREIYDRRNHAAAWTDEYVFNQLIPYIGNKRKLLGLIRSAISLCEVEPGACFLDLFAGSGVVSRFARQEGFRVIANDWEPYSRVINTAYIECNEAPAFAQLGGYEQALATLNGLAPRESWVTRHLCPQDDEQYDINRDRMFYMRKNGMRIDAIREQIVEWKTDGLLSEAEECCLLAPLLYQACYNSNTSGVFKGFHNGWGGQTQTALYRIAADLELKPVVFFDNGLNSEVHCRDASELVSELCEQTVDIAYLDPPYNQHPYGSNYHVLNSVALWDKPELPKQITRGTKAAIRLDWRTERRSAYNYRVEAARAYRDLLDTLNARYILTSYSTDGMIDLHDLITANCQRGRVTPVMKGYKRYRVSTQRFSKKPMNVEFVLVLDTRQPADTNAEELEQRILEAEQNVLREHPENFEEAMTSSN